MKITMKNKKFAIFVLVLLIAFVGNWTYINAASNSNALKVLSYRFNGVAGNAQLDLGASNVEQVSISITASEPSFWYRVYVCTVNAANCGNSLFDGGGTVQYFFRTVPPYIKTYVSDNGQWDGKDWQGIPVPNGQYMIRVYIADKQGRETRQTLAPYIITVVNSSTL